MMLLSLSSCPAHKGIETRNRRCLLRQLKRKEVDMAFLTPEQLEEWIYDQLAGNFDELDYDKMLESEYDPELARHLEQFLKRPLNIARMLDLGYTREQVMELWKVLERAKKRFNF